MAERTHLAKQEETIVERGMQIRASDPLTPLENQLWLNSAEDRIKLRLSGTTRQFKAVRPGQTLVSTTVDMSTTNIYRKDIGAAETYDFSNLIEGGEVVLILRNTSGGTFDVGFSGIQNTADVSRRIRAGATQAYIFAVVGGQVFCTSPLYQEGAYTA